MINFEELINIENSEIGHTEEDVKVNLVVPWLKLLGHNQMRFEHDKNDIFILHPHFRILVETKKLGTKLDSWISQVHGYSLEKRIFLAILTNGDEFLFFSPMWRKADFRDTLLLSIKRKQLNDPDINKIVCDVLSFNSINNGSAIKAIEERERIIEEILIELPNKKGKLQSEAHEINEKIIQLSNQLENYKKDYDRKNQELQLLEKNEKEKNFCYLETDDKTPVPSRNISYLPSTSGMKWLDYCKLALKNLGGQASLKEIYLEVDKLRKKDNANKIRNFKSAVRNILEVNSRGKGYDVFHLVSKGSGMWALKE